MVLFCAKTLMLFVKNVSKQKKAEVGLLRQR